MTDSAIAAFSPKSNSVLSSLKLTSCWELTNQTVLHIGKFTYYIHSDLLSLHYCILDSTYFSLENDTIVVMVDIIVT